MVSSDGSGSVRLMKSPFLFGIALLTGIAIGFVLDRGDDGRAMDGAADGKQAVRQPAGRTGPRPGSGSDEVLADYLKGKSPAELTAEEAYQIIGPQLEGFPADWSSNPVERARMNYQFELLASKLPLEVIERVMDMGREKGGNSYMLTQWFGAYVGRNHERAMEWADRQPDSGEWRGEAILRLASTDPDLAVKLHQEEMLTGSGRNTMQNVPYRLAQEFGKRGTSALLGMMDSMPAEATRTLVFAGWGTLPEEEKPAFLAEMRKRAEAGQGDYQYYQNTLTLSRAESHPEELREWMEKMPPQSRADTAVKLAGRQIERGKTDAAKEYLRVAMDAVPGTRKDLVNAAAYNLYHDRPDLFAMMVEMLPDDQKPTLEDARKWSNVTTGNPQSILTMAEFIGSPDERAVYVAEAFSNLATTGLRKANAVDFQILSKRLDALGLTGEAGEKARAALESAKEKTLGGKR